ncbi:hypothetical protein, partial [Nocardia abscessus]|uniref:hypothetical protein n=1 Tax=Nocardia abscessus TaxID=120957 RepID=UPI002457C4D4
PRAAQRGPQPPQLPELVHEPPTTTQNVFLAGIGGTGPPPPPPARKHPAIARGRENAVPGGFGLARSVRSAADGE